MTGDTIWYSLASCSEAENYYWLQAKGEGYSSHEVDGSDREYPLVPIPTNSIYSPIN